MKATRSRIMLAIAGVCVVAVVAGWYLGIYAPLNRHIATTQARISAQQTQLAADRVQLAQLIADKHNAGRLATQLRALTQALPTTFSLANFITQADTAAAKAGVPLLQVSPSQPGSVPAASTGSAASVAGVSSVAFTAQASGTFVALMHFLHALDHLAELVNIQTVQLSALAGGGANPKINLSFTGAVYYRS
ncbi:MAG: type II secretion system protein GspM [Ferrimicrobium sp.]|jgi:Tfp pilus assembly protein PilO|uniref:Type II secretion system protein GspM n=1 Tax=Ferrimicrobium acidiphilum TaxID=121039 RepID=A0ABV3XZK5_9ACTN|nr:type II secretion system protein GspM [Ferrimicrobium sp.]